MCFSEEMKMNTSDINAWKSLLSALEEASKENELVIHEIEEEIALQEQRKKQEVARLTEQLSVQIADLQNLLATLESTTLFSMPSDQEALASYKKAVAGRLEQAQKLYDQAEAMLTEKTAPLQEGEHAVVVEEAEEVVTPEETVVENGFVQDNLLGNWIHYFDPNRFTCQSFWNDGAFKEYDFKNEKLIEEREGSYDVKDGKVSLTYADGHTAQYNVTGYSEDCIDYLIDEMPIRFDYMPEHKLNSYLESSLK